MTALGTEQLFAQPEEFITSQLQASEELTADELDLVNLVADRESHDLATAAAAIAVAFLAYRNYLKRRLSAKVYTRGDELLRDSYKIYKLFRGNWVQMVVPHLITGYLQGLAESRTLIVPEEMLYDIATKYAEDLGDHIHDVTAEAMAKGLQAQINRKVPAARAMQRTMTAVGVSPRTMNTLVQIWTSEEPKKILHAMVPEDHVGNRAEAIIQAELQRRAKLIGENETWQAKSQAKQIVWMYGVENGIIPRNVTRRWVTARDERVCPSCGPMHGVEIPVGQRFETKTGKVWSPPLHVNCRCDVELNFDIDADVREQLQRSLVAKEHQRVSKARPGDPYDRDAKGRFASVEQRRAQRAAQVKERVQSPEVQALLQQWRESKRAETDPVVLQDKVTPQGKVSQDKVTPQGKVTPREKVSTRGKVTPSNGKVEAKPATPVESRTKVTPAREKASIKSRKVAAETEKAMASLVIYKTPSTLQGEVINTDLGPWHKLDTPLAFIMDDWDYSFNGDGKLVTVTTEEDEGFLELSSPDELQGVEFEGPSFGEGFASYLANYWDNMIDSIVEEYTYSHPADSIVLLDNGDEVVVDPEAIAVAAGEAVMGVPREESVEIRVRAFDPERGMVDKDINAVDLVKALGLDQDVLALMPHVGVTTHAMPGVAEIKPSGKGFSTNPGKWVEEYHYDHLPGQGGLPYRLYFLKPDDLD